MYKHNNFQEFYLNSNQHKIYYSVSGNPNGIPVIFVHGGPGGGTTSEDTRFFDPEVFKVILFDQRGCGQSLPAAEIKNNNTHLLIEDMENIRKILNIDKWIIFGGSWGTTLSLLYAQKYPENVIHMVLRGIFLARNSDLEWLYGNNGASVFFTKEYEKFQQYSNQNTTSSIIKFYYDQIQNKDLNIAAEAAKQWADWEMSVITLLPNKNTIENAQDIINFSILETHYFINNCFIEENQILNNAHKIKDIPIEIIHGRYDVDCRVSSAYELSKHLNKCNLQIIEAAGHSSREQGIELALFKTMEKLKMFIE
ncbi:prolyl aminopeptidase [Mycoplasma zalophi]|uniref:Proline iminopeptidase n=1 Tax=Mycoplasma zalophi TaxID=191287 RepID=A0ABS6DP75_9MOLU|nr:prolyl aminopeptidase [Mycoplasma zalophi]MBU4692117.1 prolyl aminopeptidase [Mycoplasma zalophi]